MRIYYCSDLHLEKSELECDMPHGDILLLAGDICVASELVQWEGDSEKCKARDRILWFFDHVSERFDHVIYCMGNHEHIDFDFFHTEDFLKNLLPKNVHLLEKQHIKINDIIFFGATLWSNFVSENPSQVQNASAKMPEYKYVRVGSRFLTPELVLQDHNLAVEALKYTAEQYRQYPIIILTHHAPSFEGLSPFASNNGREGAYASDLSTLIKANQNITHWVFGHTHQKKSFNVGTCQLFTNCRGYKGFEHRAEHFDPYIFFELDHLKHRLFNQSSF